MNANQSLMFPVRLAILVLVGLMLPALADSQGLRAHDLTIGERLTVRSKVLGEDRTMFVALPNGYHESGARYPVLYVLDGEFFF
jgi:enterochelin esterase-like enzyme